MLMLRALLVVCGTVFSAAGGWLLWMVSRATVENPLHAFTTVGAVVTLVGGALMIVASRRVQPEPDL